MLQRSVCVNEPGKEESFIYREIQMLSLTGIAMTAVLCDLWKERIPNAVISVGLAMGLIYQLYAEGIAGMVLFLGGIMLPVLLFGALYFFRMMGAGDIKLLCVAGGFLGPTGVFFCIVRSIFIAAVISMLILYRNRMLESRLIYFWRYVTDFSATGRWKPYMSGVDEKAKFCFSVPVLIGILCGL
ncbi:MAG: prepilin peptidase [Lachnospiraceae bacterium]|nr:prepilin peptidase [Lachnospiraceae bacterium]